MTNRPALLRQIYTEARPYVEQLVELNVAFTGFRKLATDNGLDWGQIKALLRAEIEDGEEGGSEKVDRIIQKAEFASEYAALLGLGTSNMNERNSISSSSQGGVVITHPVDDVASEGGRAHLPPSSLPPHDEDGVIIESSPKQGVGEAVPASGDAGEIRVVSGHDTKSDASSTNSEPASAPSDAAADRVGSLRPSSEVRPTMPAGHAIEGTLSHVAMTRPFGEEVHRDSSGVSSRPNTTAPVVADAGETPDVAVCGQSAASITGEGALALSPPIPQPATAPPKAVAAAPVERSPFPDNAPGAPIPGEMPDLPDFLNRKLNKIEEAA